jgi:formate dehydrogenase maturation protein FdhE
MSARDGLLAVDLWALRRRRAETLQARYSFAAEVLALYAALLVVQAEAYTAAGTSGVRSEEIASYSAAQVLPAIVAVTVAHGPATLADAARAVAETGEGAAIVRAWLEGAEQTPVERYLARAAAGPVIEALGAAASEACRGPRDERHCPVCGGLPQVSVLKPSSDGLAGARRALLCARCGAEWGYPRMMCVACGERDTNRLMVYAEEGTAELETSGSVVRGLAGPFDADRSHAGPWFPHIRIEACQTCRRYLLNVDLARDAGAVPLVDDLAAVPLHLYAQEQGFARVIPNVMEL